LARFGPSPGQRGHIAQLTRQLLLERIEKRKTPGFDDVGNLACQVLADSGQL
jgi:hypothetical protein